MIIRAAVIGDAPEISAVWSPQILDTVVTFNSVPKSPDDVAAMIAARPCFLVAEANGAVQGFVTFDQFRSGIGYARTMEHTIILAPSARGQGAGRALLEAAMVRARAMEVHVLVAGVAGENAAGRAFHAALGFERVGVLPQVGRKFGRWMDLILMQKRL